MSPQANPEQLRSLDAQARRRAQTIFDRPMVLEAGAGTGKTSVLVARVVTWCLGLGWKKAEADARDKQADDAALAARIMSGVVAITFTEAAAAEMAKRIDKALFAIHCGQELPVGIDAEALREAVAATLEPEAQDDLDAVLKTRARALRGELDRIQARTIHSFCKKLLDEHPLEIGWHPAFRVDADGLELARLCREVLEEVLEGGDPATQDSFCTLSAKGVGPGALEKILLTLVQDSVSVEVFEADPLAPERVRRAAGTLLVSLTGMSEIAAPAFAGAKRVKNAQAIVDALEESRGLLEPLATGSKDRSFSGLLQSGLDGLQACWPDNLRTHLKGKWAKGEFGITEADCLGESAEVLAVYTMDLLAQLEIWGALDPEILGALRRLLLVLLRIVSERLRSQGVASFEALLIGARDLLRNHPVVCAQVRSSIDQLLVDEFQDTNRIQCELVERLALSGSEEKRPGLFLVGDPKQSIYGWRQADLAAYDDFLERVCEQGGARDQLFINFRSAEAVLDEVIEVIAPVMQAERGLQPAFAPLVASGDVKSIEGRIEYWVSWNWDGEKRAPKLPKAQESAELEAYAVAKKIQTLHDSEGVDWKEIAVLVRSNHHAEPFVDAFREAKIPYVIERDRNYYQKREIIDAAALLRVVLDPYDSLALVTWLRSSAIGVPDAALIPLWKEAFPEKMTALLPRQVGNEDEASETGDDDAALAAVFDAVERACAQVPADVPGIERIGHWRVNLRYALRGLLRLRYSLNQDPFDHFIAKLRGSTLFEATEAARYLGPFRAANLDRFFEQVLAQYREVSGDLHRLLRELRRSLAQGQEAEEARPRAGFDDAVALMTIHKAKGLEFDTVFLPGLHRGGRAGNSDTVSVSESDGAQGEGSTWEWELGAYCTLGIGEQRPRRAERESAERVRLLYVGMTRAKQRLILLANWPDPIKQKEVDQARSAVDLLAWRQGGLPDLASEMAKLVATGEAAFRENGIRWFFSALGADAEAVAGHGRQDLDFKLDLPSVEKSAALLQEQRVLASARMERPFAAASSQLAHTDREGTGPESAQGGAGAGASAAMAMAIGSVIHELLENFDFDEDPETAFRTQREHIPEFLQREFAEAAEQGDDEDACERALALWDTFGQGPLFARFCEVGGLPNVRELPVLLPPDAESENGPVGFISGQIDLLYRDSSGELVIVDYKTDRLRDETDLSARVERYRGQGALYQRAVHDALGLDHNPRFELWFLETGKIWK